MIDAREVVVAADYLEVDETDEDLESNLRALNLNEQTQTLGDATLGVQPFNYTYAIDALLNSITAFGGDGAIKLKEQESTTADINIDVEGKVL